MNKILKRLLTGVLTLATVFRADITFDILRKIQQEGYTLVRTPDPEKRKELTLILKQIGIKLS